MNWLLALAAAYVARHAAPPEPVAPTPRVEPRISPETIGALRARRGVGAPPALYTSTRGFNPEVYRPAKPPPGVLPDTVKQPMALDATHPHSGRAHASQPHDIIPE